MTKFSFDYKGYHVIVNPAVDNIIEAYCDSENDKVLFRIDYHKDYEDKDKLIEFIKYSIDIRKNILHKQILSHLYQAALDPINNSYATFRTGRSEKITNDYKTIKKDLEILDILKNKLEIKSLDIGIEDIFLKGTNYIVMFEEEEDFNKVKEWLSNEK